MNGKSPMSVIASLESKFTVNHTPPYVPKNSFVKTVISYAGKTDVGKRRSSNQDQFLIAEIGPALCVGANGLGLEPGSHITGQPIAYLLMVADGMGGHQGGSRASELAVREVAARVTGLVSAFPGSGDSSPINLEAAVKAIVEAAHRGVVDESTANQKFAGMGTTLTLAIIDQSGLLIAHAGDSRCYRIRGGGIQRLTEDHTVANQMASRSGLNREVLENSPWSNVLWNAVGASADDVHTDILRLDVALGDRYILCSDGLNKHVSDAEIFRLQSIHTTTMDVCNQLIQAALDGGGSDNVTAVVFDVVPCSEENQTTQVTSPAHESIFYQYANESLREFDTTSESNRRDIDATRDF
jgi:serine/threonine protein phosphatase PrpC